jgi:hypothetical protein
MFEVVLTNGVEDLALTFKLRNTNIANKWYTELSKNYELYETDRFSNWGTHTFIDQLNEQINIINSYQQIIDKTVSIYCTQQDLNYLHKFFEDLRGDVDHGTVWFHSAPKYVQTALEKYNILIHQLESAIRTKNKHPTLVVTFKNILRLTLSKDDIKNFTYRWKSGTVYINYCHVGKTVLDAFTDQDNTTQAVRPQTHYSADFIIKFGPSTNLILYFLRSIIINVWATYKNFKFDNLNIGLIPVADIVTIVDKERLLKFNKVKEVRCLK